MCAACKTNWRAFRRRSEETQNWMSLIEGFSKLMEARQHNSSIYHSMMATANYAEERKSKFVLSSTLSATASA
jgi:hypothetical protein